MDCWPDRLTVQAAATTIGTTVRGRMLTARALPEVSNAGAEHNGPRMTRRPAPPLTLWPLLMLAACGGPENQQEEAVTAKLPPAASATRSPQAASPAPPVEPAVTDIGPLRLEVPTPAAAPSSKSPPDNSSSDYTSLGPASCERLAGDAESASAVRQRCAGSRDYAIEFSDGGARPDLAIITPDGQRQPLGLASLGSGVRLGKTAEWRRDSTGRPRALIVRIDSAGTSKASDLVVTRLASPACVVAVIPRGPRQNEKARAAADANRLDCAPN